MNFQVIVLLTPTTLSVVTYFLTKIRLIILQDENFYINM